MGPFVPGRKGERFILSVIDCFSQYLILIPIKDHNATTVSQAIFERVVGYFGCPGQGHRVYWTCVGRNDGIAGDPTDLDLSILSSR